MASLRGVAYTTGAVYVGKALGIVISTVTLGVITRYLGVEQFGNYATVLAFSAVVVSVTDLGIGWVVARELAVGNREVLGPIKTIKYLVTIGVVILTVLAAPFLGYTGQVEQGIAWIGLFTALTAINSLQVGILQGLFSLGKTVYADTLGRLVGLLCAWVVMHYDLGIIGLFIGLNLIGLTTYVINAGIIRSLGIGGEPFSLKGLGRYRYDLVTMPAVAALSFIVYKVDTLILARMVGPVDVGIYGAGYRILDVAMAIPSIFVGTLAPLLSKVLQGNDEQERRRVFQFSFSGIAFLAGLSGLLGFLFADLAIGVVAGKSFQEAATVSYHGHPITSVTVLQILSIYLFLAFIGSFFSAVLLAAKRNGALLVTGLSGLIVTVTGNLMLIPHYSYLASAILTIVTEVVMISGMAIALVATGWLKGITFALARSLLVTVVTSYLMLTVFHPLPVILRIFLAVVIYGVGVILLGKEEREMALQATKPLFGTQAKENHG